MQVADYSKTWVKWTDVPAGFPQDYMSIPAALPQYLLPSLRVSRKVRGIPVIPIPVQVTIVDYYVDASAREAGSADKVAAVRKTANC